METSAPMANNDVLTLKAHCIKCNSRVAESHIITNISYIYTFDFPINSKHSKLIYSILF